MEALDGELISPSGAVTCQEASARSGGFGYRATMSSGASTARVRFGGQPIAAGVIVSWRFYVRLEGYPAEDTTFAEFGEGFMSAEIILRPDGRIHFGGFPLLVPLNDVTLPVGSWVRIEAALAYSDPDVPTPEGSIFQVRVNGESVFRHCSRRPAPVGSSPGDTTDACLIGWRASPSPGLVMHFDDVGIYCGDTQFGTLYPETSSGMISGFNATPPTGFAAVHALEPPIVQAYGRDYGEDYMTSSPGREVHRAFLATVHTACAQCGTGGNAGIGWTNQYDWNYEVRNPPEADSAYSLVCHLGGASGSVRNARWAILAALGDPAPGGVSGVGTGFKASVFIQGVEAAVRNLEFSSGHGFTEGGDFPAGWTGRTGPIHSSPGGISAVELERDPGSTLMQVCMMTAVVDVGGVQETIPVCKRRPMFWT
jgi:hypothetical protein